MPHTSLVASTASTIDGFPFIPPPSGTVAFTAVTPPACYEYQLQKSTSTVSKNSEIDELMKYVRTNYTSRLTLKMLADRVHLSREYLSRYFKQHTGKTISEFLLEI